VPVSEPGYEDTEGLRRSKQMSDTFDSIRPRTDAEEFGKSLMRFSSLAVPRRPTTHA
jgi:hypothetical protein